MAPLYGLHFLVSIAMRVLFLCMSGLFSHTVLRRVLDSGTSVDALFLAGQQFRRLPDPGVHRPGSEEDELRLLNPLIQDVPRAGVYGNTESDGQSWGAAREVDNMGILNLGISNMGISNLGAPNLAQLAAQANIPLYECGDLGEPEAQRWLRENAPDIACVACWNRKIPTNALDAPRHGFLNVHPSLLPAYRGPYPLFWQFRMGETETGVTVHWMDEGMDTGDIAVRRKVSYCDGMRGAEADVLCAATGAELLLETLHGLARGRAFRQPQPQGGSYNPAPKVDDFSLDYHWPVRRAFNFMRATAEWGVAYRLEADGRVFWLRDALAWQEGEAPAMVEARGSRVPFHDGVLWAVENLESPDR